MTAGVIARQRKANDKKPSTYSANWFPPKPNFGSPSSDIQALLKKLGNPQYKVNSPGTFQSLITFTDGWEGKNTSKVFVPQIKGLPIPLDKGVAISDGKMRFYTKAHKAVQELFKAWEDEGLLSKILTFNGSFNARTIGTSTHPSNHTFGTAFDINAEWNPYKKPPAGIGKKGCLLELVPIASELGFFWGGFYSGKSIDGMHFEYAKL